MDDGQGSVSANAKYRRRGLIVFMVTLSTMTLVISGVVLFIAPSGSISADMHWRLLWIDKDSWFNLHNIAAVIFVIVAVYHLVLNWKPFMNYVISRATRHPNLKTEMVLAASMVLILIFIVATNLPPADILTDIRNFFRHDFWR